MFLKGCLKRFFQCSTAASSCWLEKLQIILPRLVLLKHIIVYFGKGGFMGCWVKLLQPWVTMGQIFLYDYFRNPSLISLFLPTQVPWNELFSSSLQFDTSEIIPCILQHDTKHSYVHRQRGHVLFSCERYLPCPQQLDFTGHFVNLHRSL